MIVSIRHSILKNLFEKGLPVVASAKAGAASGVLPERKAGLMLWLSVIHAAKALNDLSVPGVSSVTHDNGSCSLAVVELGTFSFRFVDGEVRNLNFRNSLK